MFVREFGLVPNRDDSERFVRLVKWEVRWRLIRDHMEMKHLVPVAWEFRVLAGVGLVPVAITELRLRQLAAPTWPREANHEESESLRRSRIRLLRKACHVDQDKGNEEPNWFVPREERETARAQRDEEAVDFLEELPDVRPNPSKSEVVYNLCELARDFQVRIAVQDLVADALA